MKKILSVLIAVAMLATMFSLVACTKTTVNEDVNETVDPVETPEDEVVEEVADNKLVMATNAYFRPYEYYEGDKIVGIDAEIAEAIAEKLGMELVIEDMKFETVVASVGNNGIDIGMSGLTITAEREQVVNFSASYFAEDIVVICKAGDTTFDACKTVVDVLSIICK